MSGQSAAAQLVPEGDATDATVTLSEAVSIYIRLKGKDRPITFHRAAERSCGYVIDTCGDKDLAAYTRADANSFRDALLEKGLAGSSITRVFGTVRSVFNFAAAEIGITATNPFAGVYYDRKAGVEDRQPLPIEAITSLQQLCRAGRQTSALTEILLTTSGGDLQTIQRKHRDDYIGYLPVQWLLMSNEPVLMQDLTGTVATRMVMMETRRSFLGQEDVDVFVRDLLPEAPGVLNRYLAGARRLAERGRFRVPSSIRGRQAEILRDASTVAAFASECLVKDPNAMTPKKDVYAAYESYCLGHGRIGTDANIFWRDLRSSGKFRDDMVRRVRSGGERVQAVDGLRVELDVASLPNDPADDFPD
jgi:hypothetical protein